MVRKYHVKCTGCGKKGVFEDEKDIRQAKWKLLAWNIKDNEPICMCETCEWKPVGS